MLHIYTSFAELPFAQIAEIYSDSSNFSGLRKYPDASQERRVQLAESALYKYLQGSFFRTPGALLLTWDADGVYISVVRLEPFDDGMLVTGLETKKEYRGKGYASMLLRGAMEHLSSMGIRSVYSHIHKHNRASQHVHESSGFHHVSDFARMLDGSTNGNYFTFFADISKKDVDK